MTNYQKLIEQIELKGIPASELYWLLLKYGFELWIPLSYMEGMNKYMKDKNEKAIEQALIEVDYMI
ncbi:MAG TPA: hypothetical protein PLH46_06155 [Caldisericia bacterium]|nr:hypothetical protein [Caldisericia bacterium]